MAAAVAWFAREEPGEAVLLTAARAWRFAEEGVFSPKRDAWRWAVARLGR